MSTPHSHTQTVETLGCFDARHSTVRANDMRVRKLVHLLVGLALNQLRQLSFDHKHDHARGEHDEVPPAHHRAEMVAGPSG